MRVLTLHMQHFRNHPDTRVEFGEGINTLLGNNGQGKTNVLEAVSYLSLTKSFYASTDATVLQFGEEVFSVEGEIRTDSGLDHTIRAAYSRSGDKVFTVNGAKPETLSSVIGRFPIVVLSPENNAITFGGPMERRKFLDLLLSQISHAYLDDLLEYRRVLKQRNKLLADARVAQTYDAGLIEPWTASLVQHGSRIIHQRMKFVGEFESYVVRAYNDLVRNHERPGVGYASLAGLGGENTIPSIAEIMQGELHRRQYEERKRGTTLVGPHRDDLRLTVNDMAMQQYASQGQHKTMLIALKIAEYFFLKERRDENPIMLLDDVFSELDERRCRQLLDTVERLGQTLITTTEESVFHNAVHWNDENRKFRVEQGTVTRVH